MKKVLVIILSIIFIPLILYISFGAALWLLGYEFADGPKTLAQKLISEKRPVKDCYLYVTLDPWFRPTTRSLREQCVKEFAAQAQNPSACDLLMPSEYGLSCINDAIAQGYKGHMDSGFFEWSECSKMQTDPLRQDWCDLLRAHRNRSAKDCLPIRNNVIREGCTSKFEAWEKYPDLRGSFYFGKATQ
jgi:hypothetical protein